MRMHLIQFGSRYNIDQFMFIKDFYRDGDNLHMIIKVIYVLTIFIDLPLRDMLKIKK